MHHGVRTRVVSLRSVLKEAECHGHAEQCRASSHFETSTCSFILSKVVSLPLVEFSRYGYAFHGSTKNEVCNWDLP